MSNNNVDDYIKALEDERALMYDRFKEIETLLQEIRPLAQIKKSVKNGKIPINTVLEFINSK